VNEPRSDCIPAICVAMPVYNCESTVADAIASILNQTFQDWELVVYDDGSRDKTVEVARQFTDPRIQILQNAENHGLPWCLNRIIESCKNKYCARMDGDDVSYPRRLEEQLATLENCPGIDLLGGSILILDENTKVLGLRRAGTTHKEICGPPWSVTILPHVTWMGRTGWFREHPYDERATHAQDRELLIRYRREARYAAVSSVVVGVREVIRWPKQRAARWQMVKTLFIVGLRKCDPSLLLIALSAELVKFVVDFVATWTGLNHRLLRYRVPPVDAGSIAEWQAVLERTRDTAAQFIAPVARHVCV
jgi:glycosyltransferase involved in cell wall biosynthesis